MSALRYSRRAIVGAGALATLAACGTSSSGSSTSKSSTTSTGTTTAGGSAPAPLTLTDGWAKAAETGMTTVIGSLPMSEDLLLLLTGGIAVVVLLLVKGRNARDGDGRERCHGHAAD